MKVVVREAAARDLDDILDWISKDNPRAAADLVSRILARIDRLAVPGLSHIGRPGLVEGTREIVEARTSLSTWWTRRRRGSRYLPSFTARGTVRVMRGGHKESFHPFRMGTLAGAKPLPVRWKETAVRPGSSPCSLRVHVRLGVKPGVADVADHVVGHRALHFRVR
jgi:plasmid stabilization system protein ParE